MRARVCLLQHLRKRIEEHFEDIKDATRKTDNLWDLEQFCKEFEAVGIETETATHAGGHEMPHPDTEGAKHICSRIWTLCGRAPSADAMAIE